MLEQIKRNIEDLISRYEVLKAENARLEELLRKKETEVDNAKEEISTLKQTIDNLNLKTAFAATGEDSARLKARIDAMIRQIDKCLSLMS
ncbi:MAG: hypothetical protein J6T35_06905 [Bacteroidales bacterium]|nr:hypothetical protein [Bacteroidales bacterium]